MKKFFIILLVFLCVFLILVGNEDKTIRIKDQNDTYLGRVVGGYEEFVMVLIDSGYLFLIDLEEGIIPGKIGSFYFENSDCSGDPHIKCSYQEIYCDFPVNHPKYVWNCKDNYYLRADTTDDIKALSIYYYESFGGIGFVCDSMDETIDVYNLNPLSQTYTNIIEAIDPPLSLY